MEKLQNVENDWDVEVDCPVHMIVFLMIGERVSW